MDKDSPPLPPDLEKVREGLIGYRHEISESDFLQEWRIGSVQRHLDAAIAALDQVADEIQAALAAERKKKGLT